MNTHTKPYAQEGDLVVVQAGPVVAPLYLKAGDVYHMKFGNFRHDDIIGTAWGRVIAGVRGGVMRVLPCSPELWAGALKHRTQVVYPPDTAYILNQLDVVPGKVIVESGTGSGCLTTAFARSVAPHGHVHTFEFNAGRMKEAAKEMVDNRIDHVVTVSHTDAYVDGFGDRLRSKADAVFLDLPMPWLALPHAYRVLKPTGRICTFSPCVEQVLRSCAALRALGFTDITTVECLHKPFTFTVRRLPVESPFHTDMLFGDEVPPITTTKRQRAENMLGQTIARKRQVKDLENAARGTVSGAGDGALSAGDGALSAGAGAGAGAGAALDATGGKRGRTGDSDSQGADGTAVGTDSDGAAAPSSGGHGDGPAATTDGAAGGATAGSGFGPVSSPAELIAAAVSSVPAGASVQEPSLDAMWALRMKPLPAVTPAEASVRQLTSVRGHTSFLTFATLWRKRVADPQAAVDAATVEADGTVGVADGPAGD